MSKSKPLICIIDDDESTLKALDRLLRSDFSTQLFSDAATALKFIESSNPDIVLTDYMMPDMTGLEFLKLVRKTKPSSVRVVLSGLSETSDLATAISTGLVHRFIMKPWENDLMRLQLLECLAQRKSLQEKEFLLNLALTDPLTELGNQRFFKDQLKIEIERARRHQRTICLMMIDVDHFKSWNDEFGHPEGDRILKKVAEHLTKGVRNIDWVCRYGGDEFAIILPDTNIENTFLIAERLRTSFAQFIIQQMHMKKESPQPSLSFGLACFPNHASDDELLIKTADLALYQAKNSGKNQTQIAQTI